MGWERHWNGFGARVKMREILQRLQRWTRKSRKKGLGRWRIWEGNAGRLRSGLREYLGERSCGRCTTDDLEESGAYVWEILASQRSALWYPLVSESCESSLHIVWRTFATLWHREYLQPYPSVGWVPADRVPARHSR